MLPLPRRFIRRLVAVLAVALLFGAAACTGDDDGENAVPDKPVDGGVLRLGLDRPRSLDPADASPSARAELIAADLLFDGLTRYGETGEAVPALATRFKPSKDLEEWLFRLRPDAEFANGRRITAKDVKYSIERVAEKGPRSPAAAQLELLVGYPQFTSGRSKTLSGVRVVDKDLVQIKVTTPLASLPELLASPLFGVVPKEAVEADSPVFDDEPTGSGPFKVSSRDGDVVHLVRARDDNGTRVDGVDLMFYDDTDASYEAFVDEDVDWTRVPSARVDEAAERFGNEGFQPFHAEIFYGFNMRSTKFKSQRFREAIVRAIDRRAIVRAVYTDTVSLLNGVVVDGVSGFQEDPCGGHCKYSPTQAKALLRSVFGSKKPPVVGIDYDEGTVQEAIARAIATDLKEVGIPVDLRAKPFDEYQEFAASGQQQLFRLGWIAVYRSADAFLSPLFLANAPDNVTGFADPGVDRALKAARAEDDPAKRKSFYALAERRVMARFPIVPIAQFLSHTVASARVKDMSVAVDGTFDATKVWLTDGAEQASR
jgi:oligopeptide transport system substrate-binding protein